MAQTSERKRTGRPRAQDAPVTLERMSPWLPRATTAVEDRRFYQHHGLDFKRTAAAALHTFGGDREGGPAEPAEAGAGRGEAPAGEEAATGDGERGTGKDIGIGQSGYEEDRKEDRRDGRQHLADPSEPVAHHPSRN